MDRTAAMPTTTDEDPEVQGFTLGKLWDAFQNGIAMGRARETMFESAPPPGTIIITDVGTPIPA
jgi:hypothetical protein